MANQVDSSWNSSIFTSIPIVSYPRVFVTSDFQAATDEWAVSNPILPPSYDGDSISNQYQNVSSLYPLQNVAKANNLTRLERRACVDAYIDPLNSTMSLVIVAMNQTSAQNNGSSLLYGWLAGWDSWNRAGLWICSARDYYSNSGWCTQEKTSSFGDEWVLSTNGTNASTGSLVSVDYCLIGEGSDNSDR